MDGSAVVCVASPQPEWFPDRVLPHEFIHSRCGISRAEECRWLLWTPREGNDDLLFSLVESEVDLAPTRDVQRMVSLRMSRVVSPATAEYTFVTRSESQNQRVPVYLHMDVSSPCETTNRFSSTGTLK